MATRREVLQALAALPVVGLLLPREASGSGALVKVEFVIIPSKEGELAPFFQQACEDWLLRSPKYRPVGDVFFEPCLWDASPWLLHPSWDSRPSAENPSVITCQATEAFRRPMVIDRAVGLRQHFYWRTENPPMPYGATAEGEFRHKFLANRAWRKEQRQKLAYVLVKFDAEPV